MNCDCDDGWYTRARTHTNTNTQNTLAHMRGYYRICRLVCLSFYRIMEILKLFFFGRDRRGQEFYDLCVLYD